MNMDIKEQVQALVNRYSPSLAEKGIKILVAKRYFENDVNEFYSGTSSVGGSILNSIKRARNRKIENEKYHYERNKYHVILLTVVPCNNLTFPRSFCREYAFLLKKVERAHIGLEPNRVTYAEEKILAKVEKRILKILKKSEKNSPIKLCMDTVFDAVRYTHSTKYEYKKQILGKDASYWDSAFNIVIIVFFCLCILVMFLYWLATK
jgi:hypothetical protein